MNECFKCGVSGDRALLFGAVSEKGIVKICRKCSFEENLPIMKYLKEEVEKKQTVYERLSRLSGVEVKDGKNRVDKQNEDLRKIVDENFKKMVFAPKGVPLDMQDGIFGGNKNPFDMVDNFHWIIMRARRAKKLTQKQFAEVIKESEEAIKMAEKGVLPKNYLVLVNKIENYLGIRIKDKLARAKSFDEEVSQVKEGFFQNVEEDKVKFDDVTTKTLTIADLKQMQDFHPPKSKESFDRQEMKKKKEEEIFTEGKADKIDLDKTDISQEEIDRILFGK